MVRTIILASALVALIASVSAIPTPGGSVLDIDAGEYIGTDTIDLDYLLSDAVNANDVEVKSKYLICIDLTFTKHLSYRYRSRY